MSVTTHTYPGFEIIERDREHLVSLDVLEPSLEAVVQAVGQPSLTVEVYKPDIRYGELAGSEISWPSTSDKRPALAYALADTLLLAVKIAERLDREAGLT
jgi:hypothetical protein